MSLLPLPPMLMIAATVLLSAVLVAVLRMVTRRGPKQVAPTSARVVPAGTAPTVPSAPPADKRTDGDSGATSDIREITGLPRIEYEEDSSIEATFVGAPAAALSNSGIPTKIVYDSDAEPEEPTEATPLILVTSTGQSDVGRQRKRNEDSLLAFPEASLFVVADGMGGYAGGALASKIAVQTIENAFRTQNFGGPLADQIPKRAAELTRAVQLANAAILSEARKDPILTGMGTTVCAARFSPNKQRLYIAHVGDSRVYRLRAGKLKQMTVDHTMRDLGVAGEAGSHLSRAVGIWPTVDIDVVLGKPLPGDIYMICTDGLNKMVPDDEVERVLTQHPPERAVDMLIKAAIEGGGKDNVTVILVSVKATPAFRAA